MNNDFNTESWLPMFALNLVKENAWSYQMNGHKIYEKSEISSNSREYCVVFSIT